MEILYNRESFHLIYRSYAQSLFNVIRNKIATTELAEDVLQDAFIKIWIGLPNYNPSKGSLYTWMRTICVHAALDQIKSKSYRMYKCMAQLEPGLLETVHHQRVYINMDQSDVRALLQDLAKPFEQLLYLYSTGYTHMEISVMLGLPLGTVKSRIRAGIQILRKNCGLKKAENL